MGFLFTEGASAGFNSHHLRWSEHICCSFVLSLPYILLLQVRYTLGKDEREAHFFLEDVFVFFNSETH